jgi:hypothetical protein
MKSITTRISDELYNKLIEKVTSIQLEENKVISLSKGIALILEHSLNGNSAPTNDIEREVKQDDKQDDKQDKSNDYFADLNF